MQNYTLMTVIKKKRVKWTSNLRGGHILALFEEENDWQ